METVYQNSTGYPYVDYINISLPVQIAYITLGLAIVIVNIPVILAFMKDRNIRRSPTSFIILHLSIIDLMQGVLKLTNCYWLIIGTVVPTRDNIMCSTRGAIHYAIMTSSVLCVIHLSWDRLQMVSDPFRYHQRTREETVRVMCLIWVYVIIYVTAVVAASVGRNTLTPDLGEVSLCTITNLPTMFVFVSLVLDFGLPLAALIALNVWVIQVLRKSTLEKFYKQGLEASRKVDRASDLSEDHLSGINRVYRLMERRGAVPTISYKVMDSSVMGLMAVDGMGYDSSMRIKRLLEEERIKVTRVASRLKIFIGVFVINWLPFYIIVIWDLYATVPDTAVICNMMNAALNAFINPFLYAFMSEKFRRRFRIMFGMK